MMTIIGISVYHLDINLTTKSTHHSIGCFLSRRSIQLPVREGMVCSVLIFGMAGKGLGNWTLGCCLPWSACQGITSNWFFKKPLNP